MKEWLNKGEHWIWLSASAVSVSVVLVLSLLAMISYKGLAHFWPHPVYEFNIESATGKSTRIVGELHDSKNKIVLEESGVKTLVPQHLFKVGNRDVFGIDFKWVNSENIQGDMTVLAKDVVVIERFEYGHVYGQFASFTLNGKTITGPEQIRAELQAQVNQGKALHSAITSIEKFDMGVVNKQIENLRFEEKKLQIKDAFTPEEDARLEEERAELEKTFAAYQSEVKLLYDQKETLGEVALTISNGQTLRVPVENIVQFWQPNNMSYVEKLGFFFSAIGSFISEDPREANTEGGIFPAMVGTIVMVLLMTVFVTPMGVVAAIYMREYAKDGPVLRLVRISINNLAGVPSIVFGIFGLGFFVYIIGGSIDDLFYGYAQPSPTFGTPGLLWASLTMALLTLPVVIVSTEEGLSRIPMSLREGGLALGATKFETIRKIVLPMATPAIMTGLILAIARAAGEVAPLMLVGVVKLAPELPIDTVAPFIHLENKFMHLGFHIYDVGFQSPNVEATQPLVYATSLLLVIIIVSLNLGAITI
ncbi:MAG: phosphate ABC transporter permease PstA, partial [Pseudomonadota bacterium]